MRKKQKMKKNQKNREKNNKNRSKLVKVGKNRKSKKNEKSIIKKKVSGKRVLTGIQSTGGLCTCRSKIRSKHLIRIENQM